MKFYKFQTFHTFGRKHCHDTNFGFMTKVGSRQGKRVKHEAKACHESNVLSK